uniref:Uncharacterized protein n=1 Tax=Oryza rufipogon TaxID=4529 RepID=A0A0E0MRL2_ORYRU
MFTESSSSAAAAAAASAMYGRGLFTRWKAWQAKRPIKASEKNWLSCSGLELFFLNIYHSRLKS